MKHEAVSKLSHDELTLASGGNSCASGVIGGALAGGVAGAGFCAAAGPWAAACVIGGAAGGALLAHAKFCDDK